MITFVSNLSIFEKTGLFRIALLTFFPPLRPAEFDLVVFLMIIFAFDAHLRKTMDGLRGSIRSHLLDLPSSGELVTKPPSFAFQFSVAKSASFLS